MCRIDTQAQVKTMYALGRLVWYYLSFRPVCQILSCQRNDYWSHKCIRCVFKHLVWPFWCTVIYSWLGCCAGLVVHIDSSLCCLLFLAVTRALNKQFPSPDTVFKYRDILTVVAVFVMCSSSCETAACYGEDIVESYLHVYIMRLSCMQTQAWNNLSTDSIWL